MDTTNDLQVAEQLHMELQDNLPGIINPYETVPVCSITKRVGLTLVQLKDIAKRYNIPSYGLKRVLCIRLEQVGLVQII
jgi:hypothetical protein